MLAALLALLLDPTPAAEGAATAAAAFAQPARCLLSDPPQRTHRATFAAACVEWGLDVSDEELPGPERARLLTVTVGEDEEDEEEDEGGWFGDDDDDDDDDEAGERDGEGGEGGEAAAAVRATAEAEMAIALQVVST